MVKIRLRRVGATKRPMYRIVAADSHAPRDGRFIETLGHYHPLTHPATVVVNQERVDHWLKVGAQPTDVVRRLLKRAAEAPAAETDAPVSRKTRVAATPVAASVSEAPVAEAPATPAAEAEAPAAEAPTLTAAEAEAASPSEVEPAASEQPGEGAGPATLEAAEEK